MSVSKNADDYANARIGIYFPGFPSSLTGQCVSLVKWYIGEMCGVADWQAARGNAKDYGDTLVNQGLARVVTVSDRKRGDIVVWKADGGGYGHVGVLCSNDNVFEENVGLKGAPSAVYDGNTVHPSRFDALGASWRVGSPTFYRPLGYSEVVTATVDQVRQDYLDILERGADDGGVQHYTTNGMTNDQVRADLADSAEYKSLQANKALAAAQATQDNTPPEVVVPEVPVAPVATGFTDEDRKKLQAIYDIVQAIKDILGKVFKWT